MSEKDDLLKDIVHLALALFDDWLHQKHPNVFTGIKDVLRVGAAYQSVLCKAICSKLTASEPFSEALSPCLSELRVLLQNIQKHIQDGEAFTGQKPHIKDRRFRDPRWKSSPHAYGAMQLYLWLCDTIHSVFQETPGLSEPEQQQLQFCLELFLEAIAPNNLPFINPEITALTQKENGMNLLRGLRNGLHDLSQTQGYFNVSRTDTSHFKLGENLATTPGFVVYQNDLMQLIQYSPQTEHVFETPILLVTSFINKFYILDLSEENSLTRWLVEQGYTVFAISWKNPTEDTPPASFSDYVLRGPVEAIETIRTQLLCEKVHTLGFCLGGTLLSSAAAFLHAKKKDVLKTLTLMATLIDFSNPGAIAGLSGPEHLRLFEQSMQKTHLWDGRKMLTAFNLMASRERYWPYFIHGYLRGLTPGAVDALYWASDITHVSEPLYRFYLRELLEKNKLIEPHAISINGVSLDISALNCPALFIGMQEDEISPWQSVFQGFSQYTGPKRFIRVRSGHVAGAINPPTRKKYGYDVSEETTLACWEKTHQTKKGSWWPELIIWLQRLPDKRVPPQKIETTREPAPGTWVLEHIRDTH